MVTVKADLENDTDTDERKTAARCKQVSQLKQGLADRTAKTAVSVAI